MNERYYWLKLKRDFFKRHDIRIIESMPNGKDYILFYLKLLCESVDHDGNLRFSEQIPYNEDMLATITDTNVDIVRSAIKIFSELGMMEIMDDGTYFMAEVERMIGSAANNENAKRQQRFRDRKKQLALQERYDDVTKSNESKSKRIEKELIEETDVSSICAAEQQVAAAPAVANLPLLDGTEYGVTQEEMDEWISLYPAVDVPQEFRAMRGWLNGNPKNRKTPKGIKRFINGWLAREQNRARPPGGGIANDGHERNSRGGAGRDSSPSRKYNIQGRDLG